MSKLVVMDDHDRNFQRKLAHDQILFGGLITIGSTLLTISFAFWIFIINVIENVKNPESSIINIDGANQLILYFAIVGGILIFAGLLLPFFVFRKK